MKDGREEKKEGKEERETKKFFARQSLLFGVSFKSLKYVELQYFESRKNNMKSIVSLTLLGSSYYSVSLIIIVSIQIDDKGTRY